MDLRGVGVVLPIAGIADGGAFRGARIDAAVIDGDVELIAPEIEALLRVASRCGRDRCAVQQRRAHANHCGPRHAA